jgi:Leucine-rich repeat (LRR) protein
MKKLLINFCLYLLIKSVIQLDINSPGFSWTELIKNYTLKGERKGITSLNDLDKYEFLIRHVE